MRILFINWDSFCNLDMMDAYNKLGYEVDKYPFSPYKPRENASFEIDFHAYLLKNEYHYVFSFNFFPVISNACNRLGVAYISWIYDSPYAALYSYTTINPCNRIFVFDKSFFMEFHSQGIPTVHYLPMAANTERLDSMTDFSVLRAAGLAPEGSVSFIGSLYSEDYLFYDRIYPKLDGYAKGYLEGILAAQQQVYGCSFLEEVLPKKIISQMQQTLAFTPHPTGVESEEYLFANYVLCRKLTLLERIEYLYRISLEHPVDLYTRTTNFHLSGVANHGTVDYYTLAPYVYKQSRINLNISLRSIKTGMPLRAFDIMGAGGFLLTNFQSDFLEFFSPNEDFVYFDSPEGITGQVEYYLKHPDEAQAIAANGHRKVQQSHTFLHRIREMESYL